MGERKIANYPGYETWAARWGVVDARSPASGSSPPDWFVFWARMTRDLAATRSIRLRDAAQHLAFDADPLPSFEDDRRKHLTKHCPGCSARQAEVAREWGVDETHPAVADLVAPDCVRMIAEQRCRAARARWPGERPRAAAALAPTACRCSMNVRTSAVVIAVIVGRLEPRARHYCSTGRPRISRWRLSTVCWCHSESIGIPRAVMTSSMSCAWRRSSTRSNLPT